MAAVNLICAGFFLVLALFIRHFHVLWLIGGYYVQDKEQRKHYDLDAVCRDGARIKLYMALCLLGSSLLIRYAGMNPFQGGMIGWVLAGTVSSLGAIRFRDWSRYRKESSK
jgi:hypothetical protein